ncbi:MAG: DUF1295 domain-containing protein [Candidatus Lokiarchaeota archaeon]|nr:DUF1295 domain-containing protein [Candidatus Lokiarchaeota archaeon]
MDVKKDLIIAHVVCFISYCLAFIVAITSWFFFSNLSFLIRILIADISATMIIFVFSIFFKNVSLYDPYWSVAPPIIIFFYYFSPVASHYDLLRQTIVLTLVCAWSIRLTFNWARQWKGLSHEDWRYSERRKKKSFWFINLFGLQLMPTLLVYLGCLSFYPVMFAEINSFGIIDLVAIVITLGAIIIETLADIQSYKFRNNRENQEQFIKTGLWSYSRHPNYFGEVTFWWGLFLFSFASNPSFWGFIIGPISITILFIGISIPLMEKRNLRTKPSYDKYIEQVSALIPWFRKKTESKN